MHMTEPLLPANWAPGGSFTAAAQNLTEQSANYAQGGRVYLDSFAGANDDAKLTAAMTYAAAQTHIPTIVFPARTSSFSTVGRTPYSGMKLEGPPGCTGPKDMEIGSGNLPNHQILLSVGVDASSWFNGASLTLYNIYVGGLAIQNANAASQFWSQPGGTLYACQFDSLALYGMKHSFGSAATKCLCTQVIFSGHWVVAGGTGCQFYIGGADNCLWMFGYCNMSNGGSVNADTYHVKLETCAKTSIGYLYLTCSGGWSGLLISGSSAFGGISFHGGTYEGLSGTPSTAPCITIAGGTANFHGGDFNYTTTANGVIVQSGGNLAMFGPSYTPAATAPSPFLYQTAGSAVIFAPINSAGGTVPVFWNSGTNQLSYTTINHFP